MKVVNEIPRIWERLKQTLIAPLAKPRYWFGTEPMIAPWLGALKIPELRPVKANMAAGIIQWESGFSRTPMKTDIIITITPTVAGIFGPMRSATWPLIGASEMVKTGADRNRIPMNVGVRCKTSCR